MIDLKENYITVEDNDEMSPGLERIMVDTPLDMWIGAKKNGEKEIKMKTFKRREDIDKLLKDTRPYRKTSKTTELGKQFIKFIESPSIQTEHM